MREQSRPGILSPDSCPLSTALQKMKVTPEMLMKTKECEKLAAE